MADEDPADPVREALAAIRALSADYLARLPAKLDELDMSWTALSAQEWSADAARDLHRAVHGVTGSGRVFGLAEVSDAARLLETDLQTLIDSEAPPTAEAGARITEGLRCLRAAAQRAAPSA